MASLIQFKAIFEWFGREELPDCVALDFFFIQTTSLNLDTQFIKEYKLQSVRLLDV